MGKSKIGIVFAREYLVRVRKRSFIIMTLVTPLLLAALMIVPSLIVMYGGEENSLSVKVADESGVVMPYMTSDSKMSFSAISISELDSMRQNFGALGADIIVRISPLDTNNNVMVGLYSQKQLNIESITKIEDIATDAISDYKLKSYNIEGLSSIIEDINHSVEVDTFIIDESGSEKRSNVLASMGIGYISSFMIYMFIFMFGSMVLRSVIEEKTTRIVEVIISSVKPFHLMLGKILGVAAVGLTQFLIWIVFTFVIVAGFSVAMGSGSAEVADPDMLAEVSSFLAGVNVVGILLGFIAYFIFGYLLYAGLFAAVGSAVDSEADTQQLLMPVTIPLIIGLFIMLHTFQFPDSPISFWGSIIPFTSPMVMMARLSYGVEAWELILSLSLLVVSFLFMTYLSAKIYRVGILMYGKKATFKDLWKWIKNS